MNLLPPRQPEFHPAIPALPARVRPQHVLLHRVLPPERLRAETALETRRRPAHVPPEVALVIERPPAAVARKAPPRRRRVGQARVAQPHVLPQVARVPEAPAAPAGRARERPRARVHAHVALDARPPREPPPADRARVDAGPRAAVAARVPVQRGEAAEGPAAPRAVVLLVGVEVAARPVLGGEVVLEVDVVGEGLRADGAVERADARVDAQVAVQARFHRESVGWRERERERMIVNCFVRRRRRAII